MAIDRSGLVTALVATSVAQGMATFTLFGLPVLVPFVARDLDLPLRIVGWQVGLVYVFAALASIWAGKVVRVAGPARATQLALLMGAGACFGLASASIPVMALGSVLMGVAYGLTNPAAAVVLGRLAPPSRRNLVFAVKQMGVPVFAAGAGVILPRLAIEIGWQATMITVAGVLIAFALPFSLLRPHWDTQPASTAPAAQRSALDLLRESRPMRMLATLGALYGLVQVAVAAHTVAMLVEQFGWSTVAAGAAFAAMQVVGACARLAWATLADRTRAGMGVLAMIGIVAAVALALLPAALDWPQAATIALLCLLGSAATGWNGVMIAESVRIAPPGAAGAASGAVLAVTFFGAVLGPSGFAMLVAAIGSYATAFALTGLLSAGGAIVAWQAHRMERRAVAEIS
ncbi:MAG TPA: MFS transporter [Acetobacteraceae bacterium]|nr:MFS transporter [Acetobacteraceae bacterium]